jgi:S1-C subfamily serine protease
VALLAAAAVAGWFGYQRNRDRQQLENERAILLGRIDGLLAELKASHVNLANLSEALGQSETEVNQLRELVAANDVSRDRFSALKQQVDSSLGHQTQLLKAVALDLKTITAGIGPAAGVVLAQFGDNQVISGSGFALSAAGDTVWFATNRHVVTDSAGAPAPRLGVIFNGTAQNFRAELARASDSADVAVLKVVLRGGAPVVQKTADRAAVGDPVAIIGFPNGIDASSQAKWRTAGVNAATFAGTLTEVTGDRLTIDGYGTHGSSGSAVVNGAGEVIGMVFGGERDSNGRVVYAIPIRMVVGSR